MNALLNKKKENAKELLAYANKLIFVKQYAEAEKLLIQCLSDEEGAQNLLVHLRRIELSARLKKLSQLREHYVDLIKKTETEFPWNVCLALIDQYEETIPPTESINCFQELIKKHGSHAALYFGIAFSMEHQGNFDRAIFNYQQSINEDPSWYPSYFGLSQIFYQKGDEKQGDHYFYLFEQAAPYNVYGNFETHRRLCQEFLKEGRYLEAEAAIRTLSEWWVENRGVCPPEIQIYEYLATSKVSEAMGDTVQSSSRLTHAKTLASAILEDATLKEGILFFVAKLLEEYGELQLAFQYYKRIFRTSAGNPSVIQKIGSQFLAIGEFKLAKELYQEAYDVFPDNPEIRFGLLVSNLKLAAVNVEEYLIGRERLRQLIDTQGDRVEILALLHSLVAKFPNDPDIQGHMGDVYLRLGNTERATQHFQKMFQFDSKSRATALKYASFMMQFGNAEEANEVLNSLSAKIDSATKETQSEILWLRACYQLRQKDYRTALELLSKALDFDPWNIAYIAQQIVCLSALAKYEDDIARLAEFASQLSQGHVNINWPEFDRQTIKISESHHHELVYARWKLRYLFSGGQIEQLQQLVKSARQFNSSRGAYDFLRLLNTNFDSAEIYWTLGSLYFDLWQIETAITWFEQVLSYPGVSKPTQRRAYLDMADCYIWKSSDLQKAIEYAKIALDLGERADSRCFTVLSHAYLKLGQIRQAKIYLEQVDKEKDHEAIYLSGLIQYRNGAVEKAKKIWKPLLTVRSESLRFHNIKQEILRYYFENEPYLKAN